MCGRSPQAVGIHSATDTFYEWPDYGALVGAYFDDDLTTFAAWLDEGPQYMEIRLRLRHEAGLPED